MNSGTKSSRSHVAVLIAVLLTARVQAEEILDNAAIVRLAKAGLAGDVIVLKVEATKGRYDLSTDALIELKKAGVPDSVIKAMLLETLPANAASASAPVASPVAVPASIEGSRPVGDPTSSRTGRCVSVRYYTLAGEGWSWVPASVCTSTEGVTLDEQLIPFEHIVAQCRAKDLMLTFGGGSDPGDEEWWLADRVDTYKFRGRAADLEELTKLVAASRPSLLRGACSDRAIRAVLPPVR